MKRVRTASKTWWKKLSRILRRIGPLFVMILVSVIIGLAVPLGVLILLDQPEVRGWFGLDGDIARNGRPAVSGINAWQKVLIAGGVVTLSAAIVGLVISYRRQRDAEDTKTKTEFANAAAQLGSDSASVRIAGVYAMAAIADSSRKLRQQCIDVLCGHLRLPYAPEVGSSSELIRTTARHMSSTTHTDTYTFHQVPGEREVRLTIIRIIRDHLQVDADNSWEGCDFDFTGAVFDGGDFNRAQFTAGYVSFAQTQFISGVTRFVGATFSDGRVSFDDAEFSGGYVIFLGAEFSGGLVTFYGAKFSSGLVSFSDAEFSSGHVTFMGAEFSSGEVTFYGAEFSGGAVRFRDVEFSGGAINFDARFLPGGYIDFGDARFIGNEVRFDQGDFSGGVIDFEEVQVWDVPPKFPRQIPEGLHLPLI